MRRIALMVALVLCICTVARAEETREYWIQKGDKLIEQYENHPTWGNEAVFPAATAYYLRALLTEKGGSKNEIPLDMFSHTAKPKPYQD